MESWQEMMKRVRRLMRDDDRSQGAIALAAGLDQSTVSQWTNGKTEPKLGSFLRLVGALGYSVALEGVEPTPNRGATGWQGVLEAQRRAADLLEAQLSVEDTETI